jgi:hypothetical protein
MEETLALLVPHVIPALIRECSPNALPFCQRWESQLQWHLPSADDVPGFSLYKYDVCKTPLFRSCQTFRGATKAILEDTAPYDSLNPPKPRLMTWSGPRAWLRLVWPLPSLCGITVGQEPKSAEDRARMLHHWSGHINAIMWLTICDLGCAVASDRVGEHAPVSEQALGRFAAP